MSLGAGWVGRPPEKFLTAAARVAIGFDISREENSRDSLPRKNARGDRTCRDSLDLIRRPNIAILHA